VKGEELRWIVDPTDAKRKRNRKKRETAGVHPGDERDYKKEK